MDGARGGARIADGSAEKRAKMRGVATQWAPEGSEWRIQTHQAYGASRADTGRPDADAIRRTHTFFFADVTILYARVFIFCSYLYHKYTTTDCRHSYLPWAQLLTIFIATNCVYSYSLYT